MGERRGSSIAMRWPSASLSVVLALVYFQSHGTIGFGLLEQRNVVFGEIRVVNGLPVDVDKQPKASRRCASHYRGILVNKPRENH